VKTKRGQKKRVFIQLNDGSTVSNIQLMAESGSPAFTELKTKAGTGACVRATGNIVKSGGRTQVIDFVVTEVGRPRVRTACGDGRVRGRSAFVTYAWSTSGNCHRHSGELPTCQKGSQGRDSA